MGRWGESRRMEYQRISSPTEVLTGKTDRQTKMRKASLG